MNDVSVRISISVLQILGFLLVLVVYYTYRRAYCIVTISVLGKRAQMSAPLSEFLPLSDHCGLKGT